MSVLSQLLMSSSKIKLRNPFAGEGLTKNGIRIGVGGVAPYYPGAVTTAIGVRALASSPSMIVAVGANRPASATSIALSSPDGAVWTSRTIPARIWCDVIWTGSRFVAASADTGSVFSTDGITWQDNGTLPVSDLRFFMLGTTLVAFPFNGGSSYYTSTNHGVSWTTRTFPVTITVASTPTTLRMAANSTAMVVSANPTSSVVYRTTDGINWSPVTMGVLPSGYNPQEGGTRIIACASGFVSFCFNGSSGPIMSSVSADGITWSRYSSLLVNPGDEYLAAQPMFHASVAGPNSIRLNTPFFLRQITTKQNNSTRFAFPIYLQESASATALIALMHSLDGLTWALEAPFMAASSMATDNFGGIAQTPSGDGFVLTYESTTGSPTSSIARTDPNFRELVYEL